MQLLICDVSPVKGARKEDIELQNVGTTTFLGGLVVELVDEVGHGRGEGQRRRSVRRRRRGGGRRRRGKILARAEQENRMCDGEHKSKQAI